MCRFKGARSKTSIQELFEFFLIWQFSLTHIFQLRKEKKAGASVISHAVACGSVNDPTRHCEMRLASDFVSCLK